MAYRGGIGGNAPSGPRGPRRRLRDRAENVALVLGVLAFIMAAGRIVWEVAS